jgi:hypothetical protein
VPDPYCLFCWNEPIACVCKEEELILKRILIAFFVASMKEFSPKIAKKTELQVGIEFLNEWYEDYFSSISMQDE